MYHPLLDCYFQARYLPSNFIGKNGVRAKSKIRFFTSVTGVLKKQTRHFLPSTSQQAKYLETFQSVFNSQPALFQPAKRVLSRAAPSGTPVQIIKANGYIDQVPKHPA